MSAEPEIRVLPDSEAVAAEAAEILAGASGHVALSGGSTPKRAYWLAAEKGLSPDVTLWLGDDRVVPPDDDHSNYRMAMEQFGAGAPVERLATELGMVAAAGDYEARLREALGAGGRLDLALMGLGPDSHTASLFPGKPALAERDHLVVGVPHAGMEPQVPRVTMTLPAFNAARDVVFLVSGADKADAAARAFGPSPDPSSPAALVRPADGRLLVLIDEAAAARLPH